MTKSLIALDPNKVKKFGYKGKKKKVPTASCKLIGCNNPLTEYKGKGSCSLCEEHQKILRDYGGFARTDRPYSFWKKSRCEGKNCLHNPMQNVRVRDYAEPKRSVYAMTLLHVDHITPPKNKKDKGKMYAECNHPSNLQTLCSECHTVKSYECGDF
jgi:hypothetical protein